MELCWHDGDGMVWYGMVWYESGRETFERLQQSGTIPWRDIYQRPAHFFAPLKGIPYPIDPVDGPGTCTHTVLHLTQHFRLLFGFLIGN